MHKDFRTVKNQLAAAPTLLASALALLCAQAFAQSSRDFGSDNLPPIDASKLNVDALADAQPYSDLIVYMVEGRNQEIDVYQAMDRAAALSGNNIEVVRPVSTGGYVVKIRAKSGEKNVAASVDDATTLAVMEALSRDANVQYVEPDALMQIALSPNDTNYGSQWHYFESTGGLNLPTAWDSATGTGVTVAVLDTGITSHSDLNANVVAGYDFISDATSARDGSGRDSNPADQGDWTTGECGPSSNSSWHGTHVAGTIAAVSNNAKGVAGVAFNAKISPVRVLGKCGGSLSDIADAITWASGGSVSGIPANSNVSKVINMSLGGGGSCGTTYQNAINGAVGRGTVVVVAAGNSATDVSTARPANCSNVVVVAASNRSGGRASYSNFGSLVDVAAPGGQTNVSGNGVLSTLNSGRTTPSSESYAYYQGTSMATPHVAGVAALILSKGSKTPAEIETLLKNNARSFPASCSGCGTGIVDATRTIAALSGGGGGGGASFFENQTDFPINDNTTVESPITVSGRTGNASSALAVSVTIFHTYRGDLQIDLVAPNGTTYRLKNTSGSDSADNVIATYTVNASAVAANGTWKLRVRDIYSGDTGRIDKWSLQF
jgi:serine protease